MAGGRPALLLRMLAPARLPASTAAATPSIGPDSPVPPRTEGPADALLWPADAVLAAPLLARPRTRHASAAEEPRSSNPDGLRTALLPVHRVALAGSGCAYLEVLCSARWRADALPHNPAAPPLQRYLAPADAQVAGAAAHAQLQGGELQEPAELAVRVALLRLPGVDADAAAAVLRHLYAAGAPGPPLSERRAVRRARELLAPMPLQACAWEGACSGVVEGRQGQCRGAGEEDGGCGGPRLRSAGPCGRCAELRLCLRVHAVSRARGYLPTCYIITI
jgi:hypothetical protein